MRPASGRRPSAQARRGHRSRPPVKMIRSALEPGGEVQNLVPCAGELRGDKRVLSPDQRRDFDEARRLGKSRLGAEDLVRTHHIEPCADASGPPRSDQSATRSQGGGGRRGATLPPVLPPCFPTV